MTKNTKAAFISWKELVFQFVLHLLVFIFYSFDRDQPGIESHQVVFFFSYVIAAALINYFVLPRFFYKKKYFIFFVSVLAIIIGLILLEELVLEKLYFPNTRRAQTFPGVLITLLGILPVITILSGFKFAWDAIGKQRELEALRAAVKESELQFLKSQINPHFLFNNLNNLYSHALHKSEKTPGIILELSGVLRYMLYECKEKYVPLTKEIEQLNNFIKLNKLQIEERGIVNFKTENISSDYKIAPLILIIFIENAFKHSQSGQTDSIVIDIDIRLKGNILQFYSKNNFEATKTLDTVDNGIGLENVKKRLQLLYPEKHKLTINDEGRSYEVNLSLELEKIQMQ